MFLCFIDDIVCFIYLKECRFITCCIKQEQQYLKIRMRILLQMMQLITWFFSIYLSFSFSPFMKKDTRYSRVCINRFNCLSTKMFWIRSNNIHLHSKLTPLLVYYFLLVIFSLCSGEVTQALNGSGEFVMHSPLSWCHKALAFAIS